MSTDKNMAGGCAASPPPEDLQPRKSPGTEGAGASPTEAARCGDSPPGPIAGPAQNGSAKTPGLVRKALELLSRPWIPNTLANQTDPDRSDLGVTMAEFEELSAPLALKLTGKANTLPTVKIPLVILMDTRLTAKQKLVIGMIAWHCGKRGCCWPLVRTIAAELGMSTRAVQGAISDLVKMGALYVKHNFRRSSDYYPRKSFFRGVQINVPQHTQNENQRGSLLLERSETCAEPVTVSTPAGEGTCATPAELCTASPTETCGLNLPVKQENKTVNETAAAAPPPPAAASRPVSSFLFRNKGKATRSHSTPSSPPTADRPRLGPLTAMDRIPPEEIRDICIKPFSTETWARIIGRGRVLETRNMFYERPDHRALTPDMFDEDIRAVMDVMRSTATVYIYGLPGRGKTYLGFAFANTFKFSSEQCLVKPADGLVRLTPAIFAKHVNDGAFLDKDEFGWNQRANERFIHTMTMASVRLLWLDDVFHSQMTKMERTAIWRIVQARVDSNLRTLVTTNLSPDDLFDMGMEKEASRFRAGRIYHLVSDHDLRGSARRARETPGFTELVEAAVEECRAEIEEKKRLAKEAEEARFQADMAREEAYRQELMAKDQARQESDAEALKLRAVREATQLTPEDIAREKENMAAIAALINTAKQQAGGATAGPATPAA